LKDAKKIGDLEYESFLNTGNENFIWKRPDDEWQAISLNYTSANNRKSQRCSLSSQGWVPYGYRECNRMEHAK
jgi:hypothetical protein